MDEKPSWLIAKDKKNDCTAVDSQQFFLYLMIMYVSAGWLRTMSCPLTIIQLELLAYDIAITIY